jgi:hypothetical protein
MVKKKKTREEILEFAVILVSIAIIRWLRGFIRVRRADARHFHVAFRWMRSQEAYWTGMPIKENFGGATYKIGLVASLTNR